MIKNTYAWLMSVIKAAYLRHNNQLIIRKYNNKILKLLKVLLSVGYISNYFVKDDKIIIFLRYLNQRPVWANTHICFSKSTDRTISKKVLESYKKYDRGSVFIISTHHGIISSLSDNIVGGKLICILS